MARSKGKRNKKGVGQMDKFEQKFLLLDYLINHDLLIDIDSCQNFPLTTRKTGFKGTPIEEMTLHLLQKHGIEPFPEQEESEEIIILDSSEDMYGE
jgi:hypothetical protein